MNELQAVPRNYLPAAGMPLNTIDVSPGTVSSDPGPGLKRDYAGVLEYWQMIRRHKGAVMAATVLGCLGGFVMTLSDPRIYQARTTLEIQGLNEEFLNMKNVNPVSETNGGYLLDTDIQTQVKILQSRVLLSRVQEKLEAGPHPDNLQPPDRLGVWRKALEINPPSSEELWAEALGTAAGGVRVRSSGTNRIVDVSCDSTNGQVAADFCNTLTQEYIDQNLEARWKSTEYTGQWLTKQLQDLKIKLEKQEEELQSYARATGLVFTAEKNDVQEANLGDLQKELSAARADRIAKQSKYEMAATSPAGALPDVLDDLSLKDSQKTLADLQAKLAQLEVTFTPGHTEVKRVQAQISAIEASLEGSRSNILTRIRKEYEAAERRETLMASAYADQTRLVSGKAEAAAHYNLLKRDVDATRLLYETLLQRLKEASIASALRATNIRVVDAAERPSAPYKPNVGQRGTVGLLFGMLLGVGFAVVRERADRTLQDPGDVAYYLGVSELGVIPVGELLDLARTKTGIRSPGLALTSEGSSKGVAFDSSVETISFRQKTSLLAESFRTTLTSILFSSRSTGERPRLLVLTSASPKEGKTTVVCNLGISLAEINQKVLLIDGDMRRPRIHTVFDVDNKHGLSDLLLEKTPLNSVTLEAACAPTTVPGLYVLPSGGSRHNASSLLHSARLSELLQLARESFDTVVVDTPPMVNIADARVVARFGDALILVVRSGATTRDAAQLAKTRFVEDGTPLLGTILNFWNPRTPGYSYYKYYYAGYYHYYGDGTRKGGNGNGKGHRDGTGPAASERGSKSKARSPRFSLRPRFDDGPAGRQRET